MPVVEVNGTTIHHEIDGAGRPMLVLHGGLGLDHVLYRRSLAPLAATHRLVFPDHRGNGRSGRPPLETITMEQLADDVVGLADVLSIDRFSAIGHSYGGFIAQELALRHIDRLDRLVLVATAPGQLGTGETDDQGPPAPAELDAIRSRVPESDAALEAGMHDLLPWYLHRASPEDIASFHEGTIYDVAAMVRGFEVLASWSAVDRLHAISCPTLVVGGRHDHFTSWQQSARIARRIPNAELVIFEEAGHFPWLDEPDPFFETVTRWLGS